MPSGIQEWLGLIIVAITTIVLIRAQWIKSKAQLNSSCDGCHKQSSIGKPQPSLRGINIHVASE